MTASEQERIDKLIQDIAGWKVELSEQLTQAIQAHSGHCFVNHITPIQESLDQLIASENKRNVLTEARTKALRLLAISISSLAGIIGIISIIIDWSIK